MAIVYLWDGGTNTSPYETWTKAATTYATAAGYMTVASDVIYMAQDHQESGTSFGMSAASGDSFDVRVPIYSMERTGTTYAPQTSSYNFRASSTTLSITDFLDAYGVYFFTTDDTLTISSTGHYRDCKFHISNGDGPKSIATPTNGVFENCAFEGFDAQTNAGLNALFLGCSVSHTGSVNYNLSSTSDYVMVGGSLGSTPADAFRGRAVTLMHVSHGESLGSRLSAQVDSANQGPISFACDQVGASAGRAWRSQFENNAGLCFPTTAIYRNAGWEDTPSETNLSWKMSPDNVDCDYHGKFLYSPPITSRIEETGSVTFTAYGVEDFTTGPNVNEMSMEVFYLGTSDSQEWTYASTANDPSATTSLTSDTEDWTGASGKTKFKMEKTVTINTVGEWMVRFVLKKYEAGKAIWIDPKVEIT